jgi:hypothetical protein
MDLFLNPDSRKRVLKFLADACEPVDQPDRSDENNPDAPQGLNGPLTDTERDLLDLIRKIAA